MLYACDPTWWQHYFPEVANTFRGSEMWTVSRAIAQQFKIDYVPGAKLPGLSADVTRINLGTNSGYQSIGLAHMWGAARILLLGFDFQRTKGRGHWHADHPRTMGNGGRFPEWAREMKQVAADAKKQGVEIINCSRETAITCFQRMTVLEALT